MTEPGKKVSPIAVSADTRSILKKLVRALGIPQLALVDQIVKAADQYVEHHGGRMILPLRFTETFRVVTITPTAAATVLEEPPRPLPQRGKPRSTRV